ncbi:isopentenyl-diphosphate Delta-isomerase [Nocardia sp. CS682]|uniref:isopentenyl-diphosphate Delta-isomerase n=1 Tax=Nocardia sp. CS682 TaxID=1047172 RepID=UPI001F10A964|nr:isopentenyl-diphosphate Delta-isomerase [Nocardia sp. CS682]
MLLDEVGNAIGTADKAIVHASDTPLHLAFSTYVFDRDDQVLVTRRAFTKKTWPGVWTNSCCGHPAPGESMTAAIRRRLQTELGLTPTSIDVILPAFRYRAKMPNGVVEYELCPVYRVEVDGREKYNPAEVHETRWVPWSDLTSTPRPTEFTRLSPWCEKQLTQLAELGPAPQGWPAADPRRLPPAARDRIGLGKSRAPEVT